MKWPAQGLRLHDNPALLEAAQGAEHLHALYVVDPAFLKPDRRDGSPTPRCRGQQAPPGRSPGAAPSPGPRGRGRGNPQGWPPPLPLPAGVACRPRQVAAGAQQPAHRSAWRATAPCRARDRAAATTRGRFRLSRPQRPRGAPEGRPPKSPLPQILAKGGARARLLPPRAAPGCWAAGNPEEVVPRALKAWSATRLCYEAEHEPWAVARDQV